MQVIKTGDDGQNIGVPLSQTGGTFTSSTLVSPTITGATISGSVTPTVTVASGDGAIAIQSGLVVITKGSAAALTIAAPSSQNGTRITITSTTAYQHVITFTGGTLWDGTTGVNTTATTTAFAGASITVVAYGSLWYVESLNQVTCAP